VQNFSPGRQGMMHERALRHALARSTGRCRAVVIRRARRKGIGGGGAGGAGGGRDSARSSMNRPAFVEIA